MRSPLSSLLNLGCRLVFVVIGIPVLWVFEAIYPIRIGELLEDRVGHLASNTELYVRLARQSAEKPAGKTIFFAWNPANRPLLEIWKRYLPIVENKSARRFFIACRPFISRTRFYCPLPNIPVIEHEAYLNEPPVIQFTRAEDERGRAGLLAMGVSPDDWFVCVHARDPSYIAYRKGFGKAENQSSYLDCSIENYIPAMQWIAKQGGVAIRVGSHVANALPDCGPRIIDYAKLHRDPFMDIYLSARCRFFLGNNSGLITVARIFNVPWAAANLCPMPWVGKAGWRNMDNPKLLRRNSDGHIMTFPEIAAMGLLECYGDEPERLRMLFTPETYEKLGYTWIENSPEDVLAICMDMFDMSEGRPLDSEGLRLQDAFNRLYTMGYTHLNGGGISPRFALLHRHLIEPETTMQSDTPSASAPGGRS